MAEIEGILALDDDELRSIGIDGIGDEDATSSPQR
jgi:hypothetical protein